YSLPYFSTIRNPIKFMLPVQMALIVLFGYGMECVSRKYRATAAKSLPLKKTFSEWWKGGVTYERRYAMALLGILALRFLGYVIYASSAREMSSYLASVGFQENAAGEIHKFSLAEIRWTILFLVLSAAVLFAALSGWFTGNRLKFLPIALGL